MKIKQVITLSIILVASKYSLAAIDVSEGIKNVANHNIKALIKPLKLSGGNWMVDKIELINAKMERVEQNIPVPSGNYQLIAKTEYLNCGGIGASREITLSKTVEDTREITVENAFNTNVEVSTSVSAGIGVVDVETSVSVSAGYDFTKGETTSKSVSVEISDSEVIEFPAEKAVWGFGLYAKVIDARDIPFWVDFRLTDASKLKFTLLETHDDPELLNLIVDRDLSKGYKKYWHVKRTTPHTREVYWHEIKNIFSQKSITFRSNGVLSVKDYGVNSVKLVSTRLPKDTADRICELHDKAAEESSGIGI